MLLNLYLTLINRLQREEGQDLIEYALLAALIAVVLTVAMNALATEISDIFSVIGSTLNAAT